MKKVDLGKFRAITVGLQVAPKVSQTSPIVMQLLLEPPSRSQAGGVAGGTAGGTSPGSAGEGGATRSERALPAWLLYCAAGVLVLALAGLAVALLVSSKRKEDKAEQAE